MAEKTLTEQVNAIISTLTQDIKNNKLDLPSPPELLLKIRKLSASSETTSQDIAELVKHDINISGRLIKVANSSLFGSRFHVSTVQDAITRLGQKRVQSLVTGLAIGQMLTQSKTQGLNDYCKQTWQDSSNVAALSYVLAQKKSKVDPEQALLAGMIHNIGILPLVLKLNRIPELKTNPRVMTLVADIVIPKLYGSAGQLILKSWNFSSELTDITVEHRNLTYNSSETSNLTDIVIIAHHLNQLNNENISSSVTKKSQFIESPAFSKLWHDWAEANQELDELTDNIKKIQNNISH